MMLVLCDRLAETDPDFHGGPHLIVNPNGLGFLIAYGSSLCHRSARLCRRDVQSLVCKFGGKKPDPPNNRQPTYRHPSSSIRRKNRLAFSVCDGTTSSRTPTSPLSGSFLWFVPTQTGGQLQTLR